MMAVVAAQQVIAGLPEDEQLLVDTIEGETELLELVDHYVERVLADKQLAAMAADRAKRLKERAERQRNVVLQILDAVGLSKAERPIYTAAIAHTRHAIVTDESELPEAYMRSAPDMRAIDSALRDGRQISGAELSNPEPTLRITTR